MTHTYAELAVSDAVYDEIEKLLKMAEYDHAFIDGAIDMHGIALVRMPSTRVDEKSELQKFAEERGLPDPECSFDENDPRSTI